MVICHEKKCIFIHIPKTAGTSIEQFLKDNGKNSIEYLGVRNNRSLHHLTAFELKKELPFYFNKYYKFSIIRNPYDRLLSEYYWTKIPKVGFKSNQSKDDFLTYVSNVVKHKLYFDNIYNDHFIPQYLFIYNNKKKILVNQLFKYEDLDWVINYLKKKLNINCNLPHLNKSVKDIDKIDWTEKEKERIYNIYKNDFIIFNYLK